MNASEARAKTAESIPPTTEKILQTIHTGIEYACKRGDRNWIWTAPSGLPESLVKSVLVELCAEGYVIEKVRLIEWYRLSW